MNTIDILILTCLGLSVWIAINLWKRRNKIKTWWEEKKKRKIKQKIRKLEKELMDMYTKTKK